MIPSTVEATTKGRGAPKHANLDDLTANYLRTMLDSPTDVHLGAGGISVYGLRALARTPHVAAIIRTRASQVAEWCRVQENQFSVGFRVRPSDKSRTLNRKIERECQTVTDLLLSAGGQFFPGGLESFGRAITVDSLIGDLAYFEVVKDGGLPVAFVPVDPTSIRRWVPDDVVNGVRDRIDYSQKKAFVQYIDNEIKAEFALDEMAMCVRNPRSWNYVAGYGHPELEELISIVSWLIHALATNGANYMTGVHGNMLIAFETKMKKGRFQAVERMIQAALSGVRQNRKTPLIQLDPLFGEKITPIELGKTSNADMQYADWINFLVKTCCFPPGEVVSMADGSLRPIEMVEPGDFVLSHSGRPRRVLNMQRRAHTEELVVLTAGGRTVRATGEHPFLVARCHIDGHMKRQFDEPDWVTADEIVEGIDYLVVPKPKRDPSRAYHEYIDLAAYVDHSRVAVGDSDLKPRSNRSTRISRFIQLTPKNAYALGLYMAEGCGCRSGSNVQFSFGPGEEEYAAAATEFFAGLGISSKTTTFDNHISVVGGSVALSAALRELFGHKATSKRVPEELRHARPEVQQAFLAGYIAGDGACWADKATGRTVTVALATASGTAADQVQHMLLQHGVYAGVYKADRKSRGGKDRAIEGRVVKGGDLYDVRVNGDQLRKVAGWLTGPKGDKLRELIAARDADSRYSMSNRVVEMPAYFLVPVTATWREAYEGDVYNMEVETEHTYCVGRFAVHNCALYGIDPAELGYVFGNEGVKNQQYANSPLDRIINSKERGLRPLVRALASWLNTWVIKPYWPHLQVEFGGFDTQTAKEKDEADKDAVERWLTVNEVRADRGRMPINHPAADLPLSTLFQLDTSSEPPPVVEFDSVSAWVNGTRAARQPFQDAA